MTLHTKIARHATRRAFTLMEMLIVVAIIVALAGIGAFYVLPQLAKSKDNIAKAGAVNLEKALASYWTDHNQNYPTDLSLLTQKDTEGGPYIEAEGLLDPWGKQYQVDVSGQHHAGAKPDVFTTSPEGKVIGNWK
jgi:general secretion pathway protein G